LGFSYKKLLLWLQNLLFEFGTIVILINRNFSNA
jgi:hypothetical protein